MRQYRDKDLGFTQLASMLVDDGHRMTGIVNEQLFASPVVLPHHHVQLAAPVPVPVAEPAVLITVWMLFQIFLPQQELGYAFALEFTMYPLPVRQCPVPGRLGRC